MSVVTERVNEAREQALAQVRELEELEADENLHEWFHEHVYDMRGTYSMPARILVECEVMTAGGGPTVWVSYNGNDTGTLIVTATWGADKWETWATAPNVAAYMWELVEREGYE